jgi:hypothetical protein
MPKTEILNRLELHRKAFVTSLDHMIVLASTYRAKLHEGPEPWTQFKKDFKKDYTTTAGHLSGLQTAISDFDKKVESWANAGLLNKIKNLPKRKQLQLDRDAAKKKYIELTKDFVTLKTNWDDIGNLAKRLEIPL